MATANDNSIETPPLARIFELFPKSEINAALQDHYELYVVAELLRSIGDTSTLDEGNLQDLGALIRRLINRPSEIVSELYGEAPDEPEVSDEQRIFQIDLDVILRTMKKQIAKQLPAMTDRAEVETAVREYWSNIE